SILGGRGVTNLRFCGRFWKLNRRGGFSRSSRRQMPSPQFLRIGKLVEVTQAEMFEKERRRFVKERPAWNLSATGDSYESTLHQALQDAVHSDTANGLDIGSRDRLPVRNDRQSFQ